MPLKPGHTQDVVSSNIRELVAEGHKPKQAVAMSLASAWKSKKQGSEVKAEEPTAIATPPTETPAEPLSEKTLSVIADRKKRRRYGL